jgi:hypothetical protein
MTKSALPIDAGNLAAVRAHIRQEFAEKSWWPAEGPLQAKEEFDAAQESPEALSAWCAKWLDGSQRRQLQIALDPPGMSPTVWG